MNEKMTKEIGGCTVTITFCTEKNPDLKRNLLWYLTQCYEDRISAETAKLNRASENFQKTS